jgi:hypothetical protein
MPPDWYDDWEDEEDDEPAGFLGQFVSCPECGHTVLTTSPASEHPVLDCSQHSQH